MSKSVETAEVAVKPRITPTNNRKYVLIQSPSLQPKGVQRQIVLAAMQSAKGPISVEEVVKQWDGTKNQPIGGVLASVKYHLHQMELLGFVKQV